MIDEEELAADVLELIAELVEEGSLELATRYDAKSIADDLGEQLERDPNIDFEEWLLDRDEVVELYADADTLKARVRPILTRLAKGDTEAPWNESLAAAIVAHPDDDHARLVLGDWLEQHGDARGELCSLQAAITKKMKESGDVTLPDDDALRRREESLLERFRTHLFGDLTPDQTLTFRYGFFDAAIIDGVHLEQLLKLRSATFLRRLNVRLDSEKDTEVAARVELPKTLVELELNGSREAGVARVGQAISNDRLPQLTSLEVHGGKIRFDSLSFHALESLHIGALDEVRFDNAAMGMIDLPKLRSLTIEAGSVSANNNNNNNSSTGARVEEDKTSSSLATFVETIFAHPPPRLIKLDIGNICDGSMLAKLALSPLLAKLKELHLKHSTIRCADLQEHVLVNPLPFQHLAELHLEHSAATYESASFQQIESDVRKVCAKVFLRDEHTARAVARGFDEEDEDGEDYDDYDDEDEDEDDEYGDEDGYDDDDANADRSEPEIEEDDEEEDVAEEKQEPAGVDADAPVEERHISRDPEEEDTAAREGLDDERYEGPRE